MVIVGGSRGIGAATARMAAERGYVVALTYASGAESAAKVVAEIEAAGGKATAIACDVMQEAEIVRLFEQAKALGALNAVVYSSGITGGTSDLADTAAEDIRATVEVNLTGAILCAREAVRHMSTKRGGKGGSITFVSSRASDRGSAHFHVWYAASKGGVNSLAVGLAREVATEGIRVNCVSPGPVATEMLSPERQDIAAKLVAMERVGQPEEIASAILYLASDDASYVTAANINAGGGA
jgi:NAD(P)-dependent dehydrogenase (short-subunit alcohol dehydrogenase family)